MIRASSLAAIAFVACSFDSATSIVTTTTPLDTSASDASTLDTLASGDTTGATPGTSGAASTMGSTGTDTGGFGPEGIWKSQRGVGSASRDCVPFVHASDESTSLFGPPDGTVVYFASARRDGAELDLWMARRQK